MGKRGPPPTPTATLKLAGSWRAKENKAEPEPEPSDLSPPDWIRAEATEAWEQIAPQLAAAGCLARIDEHALARYCQLWARWKAAEQYLQAHGETYPIRNAKGEVKYIQQVPQVGIASSLSQQLTRLEQEFGMTPSSRSRIQVPTSKPATDKGRFFGT